MYLEGDDAQVPLGRDRTMEGIVSADFAITALRRASVASLLIAAAGVVAWGATTYLQWHQINHDGGSASEQALGALGVYSVLVLAGLLGLVGFGCRLAAEWFGLRLRTLYLEEDEDGIDGGASEDV